jgi:hypothetical protein
VITEIKMVSLMASNADFFYRRLADYLTARTGVRVTVVDELCWREREEMLDQGRSMLADPLIDRFVRVDARDYDAIRSMARKAHRGDVRLNSIGSSQEPPQMKKISEP